MAEAKNKNLQFWEVVMAVVTGLVIFKWLSDNKDALGSIPWFMIMIAYVVIVAGVEQWRERRFLKEIDTKELEFVRSHGFETWAEYMEVHGEGEYIRESWKLKATEERAKREKKNHGNKFFNKW